MKPLRFSLLALLFLWVRAPAAEAVPLLPLQFTPAALQFGVVTLGDAFGTLTITLKLRDPATSFGPIRVSLSDPRHFAIDSDTCTGTTLSGAMECQVGASFSPDVFGHYSSFLVVLDEAGDLGNFVPLEGIGAESGFPGPPGPVATETTASLSADHLDFGAQAPGVLSGGRSFTLINTGGSDLRVPSTTFGGDEPFHFARIDACAPQLVPPGGTCAVTSFFNPLTADPAQAALAVTANVPDSPLVVALTGNGAAPFPTPSGGGCALNPAAPGSGAAFLLGLAHSLLVLALSRRLK
ncbi:MAG: choice-of-anchor D domain-containing protein [Deltaproteobacteria bacterium]|nr:choice-of-anchor D domain-containing protein [Deltaproteobacteria bacterium]